MQNLCRPKKLAGCDNAVSLRLGKLRLKKDYANAILLKMDIGLGQPFKPSKRLGYTRPALNFHGYAQEQ